MVINMTDQLGSTFFPPVMTREAWALAIGLPSGVVIAQSDRGLWPMLKVGKRVFINVEAVRLAAAAKAQKFAS
jgi:hypothetical protein